MCLLWPYSERKPANTKPVQVSGMWISANADINGVRNILAAGHAALACGEMVVLGRSMKQEPTEASRTPV